MFNLLHSVHVFICFQMDHVDKSSQCALVHAALRGHSEVIECLLELSWSTEGQQDLSLKNKALQQGLIAACSMGHIHVSSHTHFSIMVQCLHEHF